MNLYSCLPSLFSEVSGHFGGRCSALFFLFFFLKRYALSDFQPKSRHRCAKQCTAFSLSYSCSTARKGSLVNTGYERFRNKKPNQDLWRRESREQSFHFF